MAFSESLMSHLRSCVGIVLRSAYSDPSTTHAPENSVGAKDDEDDDDLEAGVHHPHPRNHNRHQNRNRNHEMDDPRHPDDRRHTTHPQQVRKGNHPTDYVGMHDMKAGHHYHNKDKRRADHHDEDDDRPDTDLTKVTAFN